MSKARQKYYYSAGLISIILLPILCIMHLRNINAFTVYRSMDIYLWDGKDTIVLRGMNDFLTSRKYTVVNLTGDNDSDKLKLVNARKYVFKLVSSKDSINGVRFHFGPKSEYWTYVRALDILAINNAKFYVPYKDDIWFANPPEPKLEKQLEMTYWTCGGLTHQHIEPPIDWSKIIEISKKYTFPIIAYILMVFFAFRSIWVKNKGIR